MRLFLEQPSNMQIETNYRSRLVVSALRSLLSAGIFFALVLQSPAKDYPGKSAQAKSKGKSDNGKGKGKGGHVRGTKGQGKDPADGPPRGDASAFVPLSFDELPEGLAPANEGTYEGGNTGTAADVAEDNAIPEDQQQDNGTFDVPTNGAPSPRYEAPAFSQQMLRFEEFGSDRLELHGRKPKKWKNLPSPSDAEGFPESDALDGFLNQSIWPKPQRRSNISARNPWEMEIESYIGRNLKHPPRRGPSIG